MRLRAAVATLSKGTLLTETLSRTGMGRAAPVVAGLGKLVVAPGNVPQLMGLH